MLTKTIRLPAFLFPAYVLRPHHITRAADRAGVLAPVSLENFWSTTQGITCDARMHRNRRVYETWLQAVQD